MWQVNLINVWQMRLLPNEVTDSTEVSVDLGNNDRDMQDAPVEKNWCSTGFTLYSSYKPIIITDGKALTYAL